jgi:hypothetical protein
MKALLEVRVAKLSEVRHMIESNTLYSKDIGLTDAHLIASCLLTPGTELWTRDSDMEKVARGSGSASISRDSGRTGYARRCCAST